ncbi:hypothetical protein ACQKWADRAFT_40056 [Trichoderma austrokoningii]
MTRAPTSTQPPSTMLSVYPSEIQYQQHLSHSPIRPMPHRQPDVSLAYARRASKATQQDDAVVAQALEIARESPDGASDPTVSNILQLAIKSIWDKVEAQPNSYIMSRNEFAVFNFFQYSVTDEKASMAMAARKRFWDHNRGPY